MKTRMAIATFSLVVGAFALTACNHDEPAAIDPTATSTTTATTEPTAAPPATISAPADLVGDWEDTEAEWVVHFKDDRTFVQDFQGQENFGTGTYDVEDGKVLLTEDEPLDGGPLEGKIEDQKLVFKLGTLTRK